MMLPALACLWLLVHLKCLVTKEGRPMAPFESEEINCIYEKDPRGSRS